MIEGACHCGTVAWRFEGPVESATACNCTVCRRYGTLWIYGHEGEEISVTGPTQVYREGTPTSAFTSAESAAALSRGAPCHPARTVAGALRSICAS